MTSNDTRATLTLMLEKLFKVAVVILALYVVISMNLIPQTTHWVKNSWEKVQKIWVNKE